MELLKGFRVLDVSSHGAVPIAGSILADWGADVIKVEDPTHGEIMRGSVVWGVPPPEGGSSHFYHIFNHGKRCAAINLKHERGREALFSSPSGATSSSPAFSRACASVSASTSTTSGRDSRRSSMPATRVAGPRVRSQSWAATTPRRSGRGRGWRTRPRLRAAMPTAMPAPAFGDSQTGFALAVRCGGRLAAPGADREGMVVDTSLLNTGMWAMQTAIVTSTLLGTDEMRRPRAAAVPRW